MEKSSASNQTAGADEGIAPASIPNWHLELIEAAAQLPIFLMVQNDPITGRPYITDERYAQVSLNWRQEQDAFSLETTLLPTVKLFAANLAGALSHHLSFAALERTGQSQLTSGQRHYLHDSKNAIIAAWLRIEAIANVIELAQAWHFALQANEKPLGNHGEVDLQLECAWRIVQEHEKAKSFRAVCDEFLPTLGLTSDFFLTLPNKGGRCGHQPF